MTVRTYKAIKALTQLVATAAGFYALTVGADPTLTYGFVAAILVGPELAETILLNADGGGGS